MKASFPMQGGPTNRCILLHMGKINLWEIATTRSTKQAISRAQMDENRFKCHQKKMSYIIKKGFMASRMHPKLKWNKKIFHQSWPKLTIFGIQKIGLFRPTSRPCGGHISEQARSFPPKLGDSESPSRKEKKVVRTPGRPDDPGSANPENRFFGNKIHLMGGGWFR